MAGFQRAPPIAAAVYLQVCKSRMAATSNSSGAGWTRVCLAGAVCVLFFSVIVHTERYSAKVAREHLGKT